MNRTFYVAVIAIFMPPQCLAQTFQSAADCKNQYDKLRAEENRYDLAFMDCSAYTSKGLILNCRDISTQRRISLMQEMVRKRDAAHEQGEQIRSICIQMNSNERDRIREAALAREQNERYEEQQANRRQQITIQQGNTSRQTETMVAAEAQRRNEALRYQQEQLRAAAISQDQANRRATVVGKLFGALLGLATNRNPDNEEASTNSQRSYETIQNATEKIHEKIQGNQSSIVNEIQNNAWLNIRERHIASLQQIDQLSENISTFEAGHTSDIEIKTARGEPLPIEGPWLPSRNPNTPNSTNNLLASPLQLEDNPWDKKNKKPRPKFISNQDEQSHNQQQTEIEINANLISKFNPWSPKADRH
ncbi:hypothetical protein [Methylibium sp.]|uniref:hypothetical protein n=1 Tax=Methylibium sp. TaxID=2067992 RepID=UPI003D11C843